MGQPGIKLFTATGICHDKHADIKTLKVRKLTERILDICRMLYLEKTVGHHYFPTQRIRLEPHDIYRAAPMHQFLIRERRNTIQGGDFSQFHIDALPVLILRRNVGFQFLHVADIQQKALIIGMIEFLYLLRIRILLILCHNPLICQNISIFFQRPYTGPDAENFLAFLHNAANGCKRSLCLPLAILYLEHLLVQLAECSTSGPAFSRSLSPLRIVSYLTKFICFNIISGNRNALSLCKYTPIFRKYKIYK